jgi:hypothetical protein
LEIPELVWRISRYVTTNDAIACARVCKAWTNHFVSAIWHTIDFDVHYLHNLDLKTLRRHGHHIRVVENIDDVISILILTASNASKIENLSVIMTPTQEFYAHLNDLLRRLNTRIEHIDIYQIAEPASPYFAFDSLFPVTRTGTTSRLSSIKIRGLKVTRTSISSLLENCPSLDLFEIGNTSLLPCPTCDCYYQHTGVTKLVASIEQIFNVDQEYQETSLLVHFPNLESWHAWTSSDHLDLSTKVIRDEVTNHCPSLKNISLETDASVVAIGMLSQSFKGLTEVCIMNSHFSAEMVMAILNHRETLETIMTFVDTLEFYDSEAIPEVEGNQLSTSGWIIQSLLQHCTRLKSLEFPSLEMDMDDIDTTAWGCHDLEKLYIRVRGLDTKPKIDRAIQLWKKGRFAIRKKQGSGEQEPTLSSRHLDSLIQPDDNLIEARVARHLLKFKKLRKVWLGWKIRKVA